MSMVHVNLNDWFWWLFMSLAFADSLLYLFNMR